MKNRYRFTPFNDGYLFVTDVKKERSDFGAKQNPESRLDLDLIVKLAFRTMSARDEDLEFAQAQNRTLSMKVCTRFLPCVKKTHSVIIGNKLFSIVKLDMSKEKGEMYIYLEEEREVLCPF